MIITISEVMKVYKGKPAEEDKMWLVFTYKERNFLSTFSRLCFTNARTIPIKDLTDRKIKRLTGRMVSEAKRMSHNQSNRPRNNGN